jgi:hypothetical protein
MHHSGRPCGQTGLSRRALQGPLCRMPCTAANDGAVKVANVQGCSATFAEMPLPPLRRVVISPPASRLQVALHGAPTAARRFARDPGTFEEVRHRRLGIARRVPVPSTLPSRSVQKFRRHRRVAGRQATQRLGANVRICRCAGECMGPMLRRSGSGPLKAPPDAASPDIRGAVRGGLSPPAVPIRSPAGQRRRTPGCPARRGRSSSSGHPRPRCGGPGTRS